MSETLGLRVGLEGEREFKQNLRDIQQSYKVLASELQLVASQFDKTDKSMQATAARHGSLTKEVDLQKQKIETLKAALHNASESFGENDKRTQNWQIQLNKAQAELNGLERELRSTEKELTELAKAEKGAGDGGADMGDGAKKAHTSFRELGGLLKDNVLKSVQEVKTGIADAAHNVVDGAKNMGSSIVQFAKDTVITHPNKPADLPGTPRRKHR